MAKRVASGAARAVVVLAWNEKHRLFGIHCSRHCDLSCYVMSCAQSPLPTTTSLHLLFAYGRNLRSYDVCDHGQESHCQFDVTQDYGGRTGEDTGMCVLCTHAMRLLSRAAVTAAHSIACCLLFLTVVRACVHAVCFPQLKQQLLQYVLQASEQDLPSYVLVTATRKGTHCTHVPERPAHSVTYCLIFAVHLLDIRRGVYCCCTVPSLPVTRQNHALGKLARAHTSLNHTDHTRQQHITVTHDPQRVEDHRRGHCGIERDVRCGQCGKRGQLCAQYAAVFHESLGDTDTVTHTGTTGTVQ